MNDDVMPAKERAELVAGEKVLHVLLNGGNPVSLTRDQIMERTGLSLAQFRKGWQYIRRSLGSIAIVEPHREATTYRLTGETSPEAERYRYWQDKHIYSRMTSLIATLEQMREVARRTDSADGANLYAALKSVTRAADSMQDEIRRAGIRAGNDEATVERYLDAVGAR